MTVLEKMVMTASGPAWLPFRPVLRDKRHTLIAWSAVEVSLKDIPKSPPEVPPEPAFNELAWEVFPRSAASRLAKELGVDLRLPQRWISGDLPPTEAAWDYLYLQLAKMKGQQFGHDFRIFVHGLREKFPGVSDEVIASHIAEAFEQEFKKPPQ